MTIKEFMKFFELKYPLRRAEKWDNCGLLFGDKRKVINNIVVALDLTTDVMNEAIEAKADLIITHHPFIFGEEKTDRTHSFPEAPYKIPLYKRIINTGIAVYSAHTNFDSSPDGMTDAIIRTLGFEPKMISGTNFGRTFESKMNFSQLKDLFNKKIGLSTFISNVDKNKIFSKIAVFPGSISTDGIVAAKQNDAEVIITSDIKWAQWLTIDELHLDVIQVSHVIEDIFTEKVTDILRVRFKDINLVPIFTKEISN